MKRLMILAAFGIATAASTAQAFRALDVVGSGVAMAPEQAVMAPEQAVTTALQSAPCGYGECAVPQRLASQIRGPWQNSLRDGGTQVVHAIRPL